MSFNDADCDGPEVEVTVKGEGGDVQLRIFPSDGDGKPIYDNAPFKKRMNIGTRVVIEAFPDAEHHYNPTLNGNRTRTFESIIGAVPQTYEIVFSAGAPPSTPNSLRGSEAGASSKQILNKLDTIIGQNKEILNRLP